MFAAAIEQFGTLHIVVSNAGLQRDSPFETMTLNSGTPSSGSTSPGNSCARGRRPASSSGAGSCRRVAWRPARSSA